MELFWHDLRQGIRSLLRARLHSALVIFLITLTVSLTVAVFTFFDAALLRALPFPEADRLVVATESHPQRGSGWPLRPANFLDWKSRNRSFEAATSYWSFDAELKRDRGTDLVPVQLVLEDFFRVLGVAPRLGRTFSSEDYRPSGAGKIDGSEAGAAAIVSDTFWKTRFGGEPDVLGKAIDLDGVSFVIVGVMPPTFRDFRGTTDVWIPWALSPEERANRATHILFGLARLAPGVDLDQARAEFRGLYRDLEREHPAEDKGWSAELTPYRNVILGDAKRALWLVQTSALVIFLIGGIDVAALLTVRAIDREDETRLRRALGATPGRLLRQSILESGLLSITGGVLAIATTAGAMPFLSRIELPTPLAFPLQPRLGETVLGAAVGLSLATGLVLGLVSALGAGRPGPLEGSRGSRKRGRGLPLVIVSQIALAMAVLSVGGLLLKGLLSLEHADLGFDPANVLSIEIHRPHEYQSPSQQQEFQRRVLEEVGSVPGVEAAAVALYPPFAPVHMNLRFDIEGRASESTDTFNAEALVVSEGYFRTLGARLVEGRGFADEDRPSSPGALVVNQTLAREYWPNEDALGKRVHFPYPDLGSATVVGIVEDIAQARLTREPPRTLYLSQSQIGAFYDEMYLLVRTSAAPLLPLAAILKRISGVDPDVVVRDATPMLRAADESLKDPRQRTLVLAGFGLVALLLAASGLYGVLAFTVAKREREMGIRIAMGARPNDVARLVASRGAVLAVAGAAIGLAFSWFGAGFLESLLYGVSAHDPLTYALAAAVLLATALIASYVPARRASRIEPWKALRQE